MGYLQGNRPVKLHTMQKYPKFQDWKRDLVCFPESRTRTLRNTGLFESGNFFLKTRSVRNYQMILYCLAKTQSSYHILLYDTDQGLYRLNLF